MCTKISKWILAFNICSFLSATILLVISVVTLVQGQTQVKDSLVDDCVRKLVHEAILIPLIISIGCSVAVMLTAFLGCYSSSAKSILGIIFFSTFHLIAILILIINCIILLTIWAAPAQELFSTYKETCNAGATAAYMDIIEFSVASTVDATYFLITGFTILTVVVEFIAVILLVRLYQDIW